jgi:antitoxin VapB
MSESRTVSLFRNGRNQAIRIPVEFEMPGDEVTIRKDGERLIIEPKIGRTALLDYLARMEPVPDFPDVDDTNRLPLRDVNLE